MVYRFSLDLQNLGQFIDLSGAGFQIFVVYQKDFDVSNHFSKGKHI